MVSSLQQTSHAYRGSVDQLVGEQQWELLRRAVEELIEVGLGLFQSYERIDGRWRDGVRRDDPRYPLEQGLELQVTLNGLLAARSRVIKLIERLEAHGCPPEGAAQYRTTALAAFDERPLDVPVGERGLGALAAKGNQIPETIYPADDDL